MTMPSSILPYATTDEATSELQLRENDGEVRIIFGVHPMWVYVAAVGAQSASALVAAISFLYCARMSIRLLRTFPQLWLILLLPLVTLIVAALISGAIAIGLGYQLHRRGRIGRKLTATSAGLIFTRMGLFAPRHRFVPADQIVGVELFQFENILSGPEHLASLTIRRRNKWFGIRYRLVSKDKGLATQIADRLTATLGCPLHTRGGKER